jgi:hypothetical protein
MLCTVAVPGQHHGLQCCGFADERMNFEVVGQPAILNPWVAVCNLLGVLSRHSWLVIG